MPERYRAQHLPFPAQPPHRGEQLHARALLVCTRPRRLISDHLMVTRRGLSRLTVIPYGPIPLATPRHNWIKKSTAPFDSAIGNVFVDRIGPLTQNERWSYEGDIRGPGPALNHLPGPTILTTTEIRAVKLMSIRLLPLSSRREMPCRASTDRCYAALFTRISICPRVCAGRAAGRCVICASSRVSLGQLWCRKPNASSWFGDSCKALGSRRATTATSWLRPWQALRNQRPVRSRPPFTSATCFPW